MGQLERMHIFTKVVETGSITKAADKLGMAKSAVSKHLSDLEKHLGTRLINRTTRKSSLTDAGHHYYRRVTLLLDEIDELDGQMVEKNSSIKGTMKVAAPLSFGLSHLSSAIDQFVQQHPELNLQIDFSDRMIDIVEEGVDLAVRIGELEDSSLQARKIAIINFVICASPEYLQQHGTPSTPDDLKQHKLLKYQGSGSASITLIDDNNAKHTVHTTAYMVANNGDFLRTMAEAGHGIVLLPTFIACDGLAENKLVPVLQSYQIQPSSAHVVYPPTRYLPLRIRAFIDFLVTQFGDDPYWD